MSGVGESQREAVTYPPDWEDEERMHFLLGPLSPAPSAVRDLSPSNQKVQFWSSLVLAVCRQLRQPVFSAGQMARRLQWRNQTPSCLPHVLQLMEQSGELRVLRDGAEVGGWVAWGLSVVSSPVKWAWHKYLFPSHPAGTEKYMATQLIKELAASLLQQLQSRVEFRSTDQVVTEAQLRAAAVVLVEASSVPAVEAELVRQGKLCCWTASTGLQVVKFGAVGESGPVHLSEADEGILSLKESVTTLQTHISSLENRISLLKRKAKDHLQLKQRELAVCCVRRGREVQQVVAGKAAMLDNLQHILHQIQLAETDAMVLEAYRQGTEALKAQRREAGLSVEQAEQTMEELYEAVHVSGEVGAVLGEGVMGAGGLEEEELERELQDILSTGTGAIIPAHSTANSSEEGAAEDLVRQLAQLRLAGHEPSEGEGRDPTVQDGRQPAAAAEGAAQLRERGSTHKGLHTSGEHSLPQLAS